MGQRSQLHANSGSWLDDNAYSPLHIAQVHTPIQGVARTIIAFLPFKRSINQEHSQTGSDRGDDLAMPHPRPHFFCCDCSIRMATDIHLHVHVHLHVRGNSCHVTRIFQTTLSMYCIHLGQR